MSAKNEYEIIPPEGKTVYILAKSRSEAIREYCRWTGCPEWYVKKHFVVRNNGRRV